LENILFCVLTGNHTGVSMVLTLILPSLVLHALQELLVCLKN